MPKKEPMRMCVVCRKMFPKCDLIRIVKNNEGVSLDFTGKMSGRGAYICKDINCINKCITKKFLNRAFETSISDEVYEDIKNEYNKHIEN